MSSRDHILQVPPVVLGLRIVQLVIAVVILGLAAYGIEFFSFDGDDLSLFTALVTMIIVVYYLVSTIAVPAMYSYWAVLGLDIFATVFWLISFALLASEVAQYQIVTYNADDCLYEIDGVCYKKRSLDLAKRYATTNVYTYRNSMAAASGLGGLEFLLFVATLAITGIYLHRHREAGGHCVPVGAMEAGGVNHDSKPMELQPNNGLNGQQPVYQQQPAVYQQQPVPQQAYHQQPVEQTYQQQPAVYAQQEHQVTSA